MNLDDLRHELGRLDRAILELVAQRRAVARSVGEAKDREGRPLRDFGQEKDVLERAERVARELGLGGAVVPRLMRLLIEDALTVQERRRVEARAAGGGRRCLVIGGAGRMGGWMVEFLASQGFAVEVADPAAGAPGFPRIPDWRASDLEHDLIVVAAPLRPAARILAELARRRPTGVVFDVGSLKMPLHDGMTSLVRSGVRVTSIHPMFGPDTEVLSGAHVILVDLGVEPANREVEALFAGTMARVVRMDLEGHDRLIAYVLGLSHALNIAFFTALAESGESLRRLGPLSSTTFDRQSAVARGVALENPGLYFEIQALNRFGRESLAGLARAVERLRRLVESGDEAGFAALMMEGRGYFEGTG